jgi:hypothetical protein
LNDARNVEDGRGESDEGGGQKDEPNRPFIVKRAR